MNVTLLLKNGSFALITALIEAFSFLSLFLLILPRLVQQQGDLALQVWQIGRPIAAVAFSPDGQFVALGTNDGAIQLRQTSTGDILWSANGHDYGILTLAFSEDGHTLASGGGEGEIDFWQARDGNPIRTLPAENFGAGVDTLDFSPDSQTLASGGRDEKVRLWSVSDGKLIKVFTDPEAAWIVRLSFQKDGNILAAGNKDDTVLQWNIAGGRLLHEQKVYAQAINRNSVRSMAFSPDLQFGASCHNGIPDIFIWELNSGREVRTLEFAQHAWSMEFSPDGRILATGGGKSDVDPAFTELFPLGQGYLIHLWGVPDGKEYARFKGHTDSVTSMAWSPDGGLLVSGSYDGTVRLWQVR